MIRRSRPFPHIMVPVISEFSADNALHLAKLIQAKTQLLGLIQVDVGKPLSSGNVAARTLRHTLRNTPVNPLAGDHVHISVSFDAWKDLNEHIEKMRPDLVILDWEILAKLDSDSKHQVLSNPAANLAFIHGKLPNPISRSLVSLRGGPNAQLALRLTLALPKHQISAINIHPTEEREEATAPFQGLAQILPSLPEVKYQMYKSDDPLDLIQQMAQETNLLVIGASSRTQGNTELVSTRVEKMVADCPVPVVVVKSNRREPENYSGPEAIRSGAQAISILVDKWFAENTYHANEFSNLEELYQRKINQKVTISLALPALNEEKTVGKVLSSIKKAMMEDVPLLDEIVLIDSNSTDRTREIARDLGVPVYIHQELLPKYGARTGKGEALWKSLYVTKGDIVIWIDSDIVNIHPRFVYGVLGPMLFNPNIQFVKGFYQRPLKTGRKTQSTGGGRVTELTARPLLNLFYPELSGVIQPLSGEYGGRRTALEQLTFYSGYGVETGLLIDVFEKYGLHSIAQVDLLERIHHNQTLQALSKMSFVIMQTVFSKLERRFARPLLEEVNQSMKLIEYVNGAYNLDVQELAEQERMPMNGLPEYLEQFAKEEQVHA